MKLYTWTTPNGYKVPIMLEELGLPYEIVPVNISAGDQKKPDFQKMNPNRKIPVLVGYLHNFAWIKDVGSVLADYLLPEGKYVFFVNNIDFLKKYRVALGGGATETLKDLIAKRILDGRDRQPRTSANSDSAASTWVAACAANFSVALAKERALSAATCSARFWEEMA